MNDIIQLLADAAGRYGVRPELAIEVAVQESGLNPEVRDGTRGEIGIMQLMPDTRKQYGLSDADARDHAQNIDAGVHYLGDLLDRFSGDEPTALAAYNWGPTNVAKKGGEAAPESTKSYVASILERATSSSKDSNYQLQAVGPFDTGTIVAWGVVVAMAVYLLSEA